MIVDLSRLPLPTAEGTYWHREGAVRGECSALGLRVRAGSSTWIFDYHDTTGRKRRRSYAGKLSFSEASRAVLVDRVSLAEGVAPGRDDGAVKMSELLAAFASEIETGVLPTTGERRRSLYIVKLLNRIAVLQRAWSDRTGITRADISRLLDAYNDRPGMQRNLYDCVQQFCRFAEDRYDVKNVARGMKARGGSVKGTRFLSTEELALAVPVMRAAGEEGRIMLFSLLTGRRKREITEMPWSEIEGDLHRLPAARAKNHHEHLLPLSPAAVELLGVRGSSPFIFQPRRVRNALAAVNAVLEVPIKFHDLRRTAATHLRAIGCPLEVVSEILNHKSPGGVTSTYERSDPLPRMREWLNRHHLNITP